MRADLDWPPICWPRNADRIDTAANVFREIRARLGATQAEIGAALGVTQSNVSFYERGQTVPPDVAARLITFARKRGLLIGYDHVYGAEKLPPPRQTV